MPTRTGRPVPYRLLVVSEQGGAVSSSSGLSVNTVALGRKALDTLVVVGGSGAVSMAAHAAAGGDAALVHLIRRTARRVRRVASVCTGAFLLAEAGLLDGRRATTHWQDAQALQRLYPALRVERDLIYVRDGQVWTSGGVTAGIDLSLALIEDDLGVDAAQATARELVVYHRRVGGQSQFSTLLEMAPESDRVRQALQFAREHLRQPLPVERLAAAVHVGVRQLGRLFVCETGETPAKAVERLRAEAARLQVTSSDTPIETVARRTGFASAERMRRAFVRLYGQPPQAMRRVARQGAGPGGGSPTPAAGAAVRRRSPPPSARR